MQKSRIIKKRKIFDKNVEKYLSMVTKKMLSL